MFDQPMFWVFLCVVWVSGVAMIAYALWLKSKAPQEGYEKRMDGLLREFSDVRTEVASLALAIGLRKREQQVGMHPGSNVPPGARST